MFLSLVAYHVVNQQLEQCIFVTLQYYRPVSQAVLSQQIVLFSSTKQTAPVLLPVSYFSMLVSSFTLSLSPAVVWCRAEPNFPLLAQSRISDQDRFISVKPFHSVRILHRFGKTRNVKWFCYWTYCWRKKGEWIWEDRFHSVPWSLPLLSSLIRLVFSERFNWHCVIAEAQSVYSVHQKKMKKFEMKNTEEPWASLWDAGSCKKLSWEWLQLFPSMVISRLAFLKRGTA